MMSVVGIWIVRGVVYAHEGAVFDAVPLGQLAGPPHGLCPHALRPSFPPVRGAFGCHIGDNTVYYGQRALGRGAGGGRAGAVQRRVDRAAEAVGGTRRLRGEGAVAAGPLVGMVAVQSISKQGRCLGGRSRMAGTSGRGWFAGGRAALNVGGGQV